MGSFQYENDYFYIYYNNDKAGYIKDLIDTLNINLKQIMSFFKINTFKKKKSIYIWDDIEAYKNHIIPFVGEYQSWMVADTFDDNINILSYDLYLSGFHNNSNILEYKKIIIHELVHACQQELNPNARNVIWFWEALATNLSNQNFHVIDINYSKNDIIYNYRNLKNPYSVSYTIGKYLLHNYSNSQILEYVNNPTILLDDTETILEHTKLWTQGLDL